MTSRSSMTYSCRRWGAINLLHAGNLMRAGAIAVVALALAGCSMPAARAVSSNAAPVAESGQRVSYGKNQSLARSDCRATNCPADRQQAVVNLPIPGQKIRTASAALDPALLGFAPVDRREADDFSLSIARDEARKKPSPLAFGMLSATFGQSWNYDLRLRENTAELTKEKLVIASAATDKTY